MTDLGQQVTAVLIDRVMVDKAVYQFAGHTIGDRLVTVGASRP